MERQKTENYYKKNHFNLLLLVLSIFLLIGKSSQNESQKDLFSKNNLRFLSNATTATDEICERAESELNEYYQSGDLSIIGLDNETIKCEDKDKPHIKAIINILKSNLGSDGDNDESNIGSSEPTSLRNLGEDDLKDNAITYGKHLIAYIFFLAVGVLCIPGWLICCFCCCCNCCCCCCCKKPSCKIPCFIITFVFYATSIAICIYGLSQSNQFFEGLANTECSLLRFVDEVIIGETKQTLPRWGGINGIYEILDDLNTVLHNMKISTSDDLDTKIAEVGIAKSIFLGKLKDVGNKYNPSGTYKDNYIYTHPGSSGISGNIESSGDYILDLIKTFGTYDETNEVGNPADSSVDLWVTEYKLVSTNADSQMSSAKTNFDSILGTQFSSITDSLKEGTTAVDDISSSFNDIKSQALDSLSDYSSDIDYYGKLGFKIYYGVLALMNLALAAFILLICLCSGKSCTNCCCCRCICKLFTHILWNILWFFTIITFLLGSIVSIIGEVGGDLMTVVSYVVSEDNLNSQDGIDIGEAKKYLSTCINGNGSIENDLGFNMDSLQNFDDIKKAQGQINNITEEFESKLDMITYKLLMENLRDRYHFNATDFSLLKPDASSPFINLADVLTKLNTKTISLSNKKWELTCPSTYTCDDTAPSGTTCYEPKNCKPHNKLSSLSPSDPVIKEAIDITQAMEDIMKRAWGDPTLLGSSTDPGFKISLDDLKDKYHDFLNSYINGLKFFNTTINKLTEKINQYAGEDGGMFDFLNCKFIGKNIKIILKYLKDALGGKVKTIGILMIVVGCSLFVSISSTILIIVIINLDIDKNKKDIQKNEEIREYPLNENGRIIRYE